MSLRIYASRHTYQPLHPVASPIDHVWISEDFLAATFRRFVNHAQRRYGSRVPGPLEARRRLSKRRNAALAKANTALANAAGLEDVASLFGKYGSEHMGWWKDQTRRWQLEDAQRLNFFAMGPPKPPVPLDDLDDQSVDATKFGDLSDVPGVLGKATRKRQTQRFLRKHPKLAVLKQFVRHLYLEPHKKSALCRRIFNHMLLHSQEQYRTEDLVGFLNDPFLNDNGHANYLAAVQYLVTNDADATRRRALLDSVEQALRLGLIGNDELTSILHLMPNIQVGGSVIGKENVQELAHSYRSLWDAIGHCHVFNHKDLSPGTISVWMKVLVKAPLQEDVLHLAKDIIFATRELQSNGSSWAPVFVIQWLDLLIETQGAGPQFTPESKNADFINDLLGHDGPDAAATYIVRVTEFLVSLTEPRKRRMQLLEAWRDYLLQCPMIPSLVLSHSWLDMQRYQMQEYRSAFAHDSVMLSPCDRILLRLWLLRLFTKSFCDDQTSQARKRVAQYITYNLLHLFDVLTQDADPKTRFMTHLVNGLRELDLPINKDSVVLLALAAELKGRKRRSSLTRQTLLQLESNQVPFAAVFANLDSYNATKQFFFSDFEHIVRKIDITGPSFIDHSVRLAKTGDSRDLWTLIRILRSHTPLKIALSWAWQPKPTPDDRALVKHHPEPGDGRTYPDPHAGLALINLLAVTFAGSTHISPRRAFALIYWLYIYLMNHGAPVKPAIVRALYHAGVVRYRREGKRVSSTKYAWIYALVESIEGREVAQQLMPPLRHETEFQDDDDVRAAFKTEKKKKHPSIFTEPDMLDEQLFPAPCDVQTILLTRE